MLSKIRKINDDLSIVETTGSSSLALSVGGNNFFEDFKTNHMVMLPLADIHEINDRHKEGRYIFAPGFKIGQYVDNDYRRHRHNDKLCIIGFIPSTKMSEETRETVSKIINMINLELEVVRNSKGEVFDVGVELLYKKLEECTATSIPSSLDIYREPEQIKQFVLSLVRGEALSLSTNKALWSDVVVQGHSYLKATEGTNILSVRVVDTLKKEQNKILVKSDLAMEGLTEYWFVDCEARTLRISSKIDVQGNVVGSRQDLYDIYRWEEELKCFMLPRLNLKVQKIFKVGV